MPVVPVGRAARRGRQITRLALDARGKLTAKNIVATCFSDLHITGRYEFAKLHNAFLEIGNVLGEDPGSSLQIQKILGDTGCTLAEAQAAYHEGVDIPTLPYVSSYQMNLDGLNTVASARALLVLDLTRPAGYSETNPPKRQLLDEGHDGFRVTFSGTKSPSSDARRQDRSTVPPPWRQNARCTVPAAGRCLLANLPLTVWRE